MEAAFNADFSAVRVHRDQAAAAAAIGEGARAFTAGAAIYFAPGQYQPGTGEGQALLVHELTHVLQQTGRASSGGKIRATSVAGEGELQRDAFYRDLVADYQARAEEDLEGESTSRAQRTRALENAINIINEAIGLRAELTTAAGDHPTIVALEQLILGTGEHPELAARLDMQSSVVRGFVFDCLKLLGRFQAAAKIIDDDPGLVCRLRHVNQSSPQLNDFIDYLIADENHGRGWFYSAIESVYESAFPYNLLQGLWEYLVRPELGAELSHDYRDIYTAYFRLASASGFAPNERIYAAHAIVQNLDERVRDWQRTFETAYSGRSPSVRKFHAAEHVERAGRAMQEGNAVEFRYRDGELSLLQNSGNAHLSSLGRDIRRLGAAAILYWQRVGLYKQISAGAEELSAAGEPSREEVFENFVATVEQQATALLGGDAIPSMGDYATAISGFLLALEQHSVPLSNRLQWNIFRYEHRNIEHRRDAAAWLGWGIDWIRDFSRNLLNRYNRDVDLAADLPDYRLTHRLQVAFALRRFAEFTRRRALLELTGSVLSGYDRRESYLLITEDFARDRGAPLDQLNEDYRGIIRGIGLTAAQLVGLYGVLHLESFNRALSGSLDAHEADVDSGTRRLVGDAVSAARRIVPRPTRWIVANDAYQIVYYQAEQQELPDKTLRQLVDAHPVFQRLVGEHSDGDFILPRGYGTDLVVWHVPPLHNIIRKLRSFTALDGRVLALAGLEGTVSDPDWFAAFIQLMEAGLEDSQRSAAQRRDYNELHRLLNSGLNTARGAANTRRAYVLRRAAIRRRRALAETLGNDLETYSEDHDIRDYGVPNTVIEKIEEFVRLGWDVDMPAHEAALLLGMAAELKALFIEETWLGTIREDRYDLVTGYYGMVERAIDLAEDHPERIRAILFLEENLQAAEQRLHREAGSAFENPATLLGNLADLVAVKASLDRVIADVQRRFGFESDRQMLRSLTFVHEFPVGEVMSIAGHDYQVSRVYRSFRFHPPYGVGSDAESPALVTGLDGRPLPANARLLRYSTDTGDDITVRNRPEDMRHLQQLDEIISTAAFVASLDSLEAAMEQAIETGLDLAELIPGIGQGVMVTRILFAIGEFVARDLPDIQQKLFENPQIILDNLGRLIGDELETAAPRFLEYMLFGDLPFESNMIAPEAEDSSHAPSRRRLQRLFRFVSEMCEDALRAFVRLRGRMRGAFVQAQGRIVASPTLLMLVDALPLLLTLAETARNSVIASEALDLTDPEALQTRLKGEIQSIVNSMMEIEIPREIIPMGVAIEVILAFAIGKFGRKGKIVREILEVTNTLGDASDLIAQALDANGLNPNRYWREQVGERLQPLLEHAQRNLYQEIAFQVSTATNSAIVLDAPELEEANIQFDEAEPGSVSLEPYKKSGELRAGVSMDEIPGSGQPLPAGMRGEFAAEYGHDFSHVRLHRDARAAELTSAANAYALTGGSHIYVASGLNLESDAGRRIMRHELAHVLQQTGPRPRERDHGSQPIGAARGAGVRYEARREDAAERMARRAETSDWEEIVAIEGAGGTHWMPTMASVATLLLSNLTDQDVAENQAEAFEERVPRSVSRKATYREALREARDIWRDVKRNMGDTSKSSYRRPLNHNRQGILTYVNTFSETVNRYIPGIVLRSIQTRANGRVRLRPRLFANNLETYLFARTGLVVNIDMDGDRAGTIAVRYLHLANISSRSGVWQEMKSNSLAFIRTHRANRLELFNHANSWRQIKHFIATRLNEKQVWHSGEFRLSNAFIDEVTIILLNIGDVEVGTWADYKDTDQVGSQRAGLRIDTHGGLTGARMPQAARNDRESHHIPQYLLVEYFRNDNGKLFSGGRNSPERIPGFYPLTRGSGLESFKADGSRADIDLHALDPNSGRGDNLPAISLAAVTHQRGRLHMNASSTWGGNDELNGQATQSDQINEEFLRNIRTQQITGSKAEIAAAGQALTGTDLDLYRGKILSAMRDTYASMYDVMMAALPNALVRYEIPYYNSVAMAQHNVDSEDALPPGYRAPETTAEIQSVVAAIRAKNSEIMDEWGR